MLKSKMMRNVLTATLALALLIPVPALGLTFIGTWRYFTSTTGGTVGNIGPGNPGQTPIDAPNNYTLTIGMGKGEYISPSDNITKYSVTATRDFTIDDFKELVRISHSFGSFLNDGSINATITIQRFGVANDPFNFPPYSFTAPPSAPPGANPFLNDFFRTGVLTKGQYRLTLTVTYTRTPTTTSSWNNSSPHVFNFRNF